MFQISSKKTTWKQVQLPGIIWQVKPDPVREILALEVREPESQQVLYIGLDLTTQRLLPGINAEDWWSGMETVHDGVVICHGYEAPDVPVHEGVRAWQLRTGGHRWERSKATFEGITPESQVLLSNAERRPELVDIYSGEKIRNPNPEELEQIRQRIADKVAREQQDYGYPVQMELDRPELMALTDHLPDGTFHTASVWARPPYMALAYHINYGAAVGAMGPYDLELVLFRKEKRRQRWVLETGMDRMQLTPFFVFRDRLFCIQNRTTLLWVDVSAK